MTRLPADIQTQLAAAAPGGVEYSSTTTPHGAVTGWCGLANSEDLLAVGKMLLQLGARLAMVSALQPPAPEEEEETKSPTKARATPPSRRRRFPRPSAARAIDGKSYEIDYHFLLGGDFLTVIAYVPAGGSIPSLTPLFRAADWPEREIMENYSLIVRDHPDPRRLFLDPAIDAAVLERLIPFSTLVNAASTKALWDKVLAAKGGAS